MWSIILRDIKLAIRSGGGFSLTLAFFLIVIMIVPFGVGANLDLLSRIAPGLLWIGALLSCLLSLDRIFQLDWEDGTLEALATSPIPLSGIAIAKATAHWITTGLPITLASLPLGYLLNLNYEAYFWLFTTLAIG
ncbi:heme exporter protein CcmB, partial [bacterium]|nr:heme exporter protein CcmB [bacterium]